MTERDRQDILRESRRRAGEAALQGDIIWICRQCRQEKVTDNRATAVHCGCGYWMQWSEMSQVA